MPKNNLVDLHNILMEQLERLNDDELDDDALNKEITRSKAMGNVAKVIVDNASVMLEAQQTALDYGISNGMNNILIENKEEEKK